MREAAGDGDREDQLDEEAEEPDGVDEELGIGPESFEEGDVLAESIRQRRTRTRKR